MDILNLLKLGMQAGASDLHIGSGLPPIMRVDGDIRPTTLPPISHQEVHSLIYAIMNDKHIKEFEAQGEIDFAWDVPEKARVRVNVFTKNCGIAAVFRIIPKKILTLEQLGLKSIFKKLALLPNGLILITGPTGSGKSSTLAAMLDYINGCCHKHIITVEDPIEFVHNSNQCLISQREVGRDTQSFSRALHSALREDPDVIMVGEMRSLETFRAALTAAETGHLVLATLHTTSAAKAINRIIDVFPTTEKSVVRSILSESLGAVVSQRLLKRVGGGRVIANEIMVVNSAIRNLIREDKIPQITSTIQMGGSLGMQTMEQCLMQLSYQGLIEPQSDLRAT